MKYIIKKESDGTVLNNLIVDLGNLNPLQSWVVEVKPYRKKRSLEQNALYWNWLTVLEEQTELGYRKEELHEAFKYRFLGMEKKKTVLGQDYETIRSTTSLNTKEFTEYLDKVLAFAMLYDIQLPSPERYGLGS